MLRNVGRLDSLTRSIDGAPSDADLALEFNNPNLFLEKKLSRKNIFRTFSRFFFDFEKFYFIFGKNILKSKIWSGIQKSYLENRTSI